MNKPVKLITVGNSTGVILPKEMLAQLRVEAGDTLFATEMPGGVKLQLRDPAFEAQVQKAERIMREDRDILHALAQ